MRKALVLISACFALFATAAIADTEKPPELDKAIHAKTPYGEATLRKIGFRVFDASLWTDAKAWNDKVEYALSLQYYMNFSPEELARRTVSEMQRTVKSSETERAAQYHTLVKLFPTIKPGDRITALYHPASGIQLYYNGAYTGEIRDATFAKAFMGVWMSPHTSEPDTRALLIKLNTGDNL